MNLELFSCSGGLAEGFRRAGIVFDMVVDKHPDAIASYTANLGRQPVAVCVHDLRRMIEAGWRADVHFLVADPPCSPWSRAGSRKGLRDKRDCLETTVEIIALLRPEEFLIANVPGLDDGPNWPVVQKLIGGLTRHGYCVADYRSLDAADYGVPQHRPRPFWFGHRGGPCLTWPLPTHGPDAGVQAAVPGTALLPYVTCQDALGHLSGKALGRPVRLRKRACNGKQHGTVPDRPARVVGTSNLSDGNLLLFKELVTSSKHPPSDPDRPARVVKAGDGGGNAKPILSWPWTRPSTTVTSDPNGRIHPPGKYHTSGLSQPNAIELSERAAAILQGFPDQGWRFAGKTKASRWSQIGQAVPPALAEAVARQIVARRLPPCAPPPPARAKRKRGKR